MSTKTLGPRSPLSPSSTQIGRLPARSMTPTQASIASSTTKEPAPTRPPHSAAARPQGEHFARQASPRLTDLRANMASQALHEPLHPATTRPMHRRAPALTKAPFSVAQPALVEETDNHAWLKDHRASRRLNDISKRSRRIEREESRLDEDGDEDFAPRTRRNRFER